MPRKTRHWRPYHKLSIDEAWHIKQIGRARGIEHRVLYAYRRAGKLRRLREVMTERERRRRDWPAGARHRIDSTVTVGMVFGVGARIVGMIWQGKYWADA